MWQRCFVTALALTASLSAYSQVPDGFAEADYGAALWTQTIQTGYGDNFLGVADVANGSEIDAVYALNDFTTLRAVVAGNLESNWNRMVLLIDTGTGGFNTLPSSNAALADGGYMNLFGGTKFDAAFAPSYAMIIQNGDYDGASNMLFVDFLRLGPSGEDLNSLTDAPGVANLARRVTDVDGFGLALDNSNIFGVTGGPGGASSGAGVFTGAEFTVPLALIGNPTGPVRLGGWISDATGKISNQVVGGLPTGSGNFNTGVVDFSTIAGNQFVTVNPVPEPGTIAALGLGLAALARRTRRGGRR